MPRERATRAPTAHEVEREARRLLPRLLRDAGCLRPHRSDANTGAEFGLFTRRNAYARPLDAAPACLVEAFARRHWLEQDGDRCWRLSDAGAAWLRRQEGGGDPFRAQHQRRTRTVADVGGVRRPVTVNEGESPLGWLRRRAGRDGKTMVEEHQYRAGERLRADFWLAHMSPRVTSNWETVVPSRRTRRAAPAQAGAMRDRALAARQRVRAALDAVGPELAGVLIDVCCHLQGLEEAEREQGWPRRSAKVVLQLALTRLARHYGLVSQDAAAEPVRRRLRHWGQEDYRPTLDQWR